MNRFMLALGIFCATGMGAHAMNPTMKFTNIECINQNNSPDGSPQAFDCDYGAQQTIDDHDVSAFVWRFNQFGSSWL